jgi:hypothetical protein
MDAARTMMMEFKSPYNFWAEAVNTACHTTNQVYLRKILNKTPYEILTRNKPNVKYLRVFSCGYYLLKKGNRLSKFEPRAIEGIFVGYALDSYTYKVYNKTTGQVEESFNVRFDENDASNVKQVKLGDVGDVMPPEAIRRMGVDFYLPIEEHLLAEGEGQCSTQVEPSPSQDQQAPQHDPCQEQTRDPPTPSSLKAHTSALDDDQGQAQDQAQDGATPSIGQSQDQIGQDEGQNRDDDGGDDQVDSQETLEEAQTRCGIVDN